jgi:hypothetical protein
MKIDRFNTKINATEFAPAQRDNQKKVELQMQMIEDSEFLNKVLANSPWMFIILNDKRQVVYSNSMY